MQWQLDPSRIEVVAEVVAAMLRAKTPAERFAITSDANHIARQLLAEEVHRLHPDWSDEQIRSEVVRTMLGGQLSDNIVRRASDLAIARAMADYQLSCRLAAGAR